MALKRVYRKYGRAYKDSDGCEYPGVTTILNVMDKRLDTWKMGMALDYQREQIEAAHKGERLLDWGGIKKEAMKAPNNYRDKKGDRGTEIHKLIEDHLNKIDVSDRRQKDAKLNAIMFQVEKWIMNNELKPVLVEAYLLSKEHGYAGGVDLIARRNNGGSSELILVDIKTGKTLQDEHVWQMAAYAKAYEEMYGEPIDTAFILHIDYDNQIMAEARHTNKEEIPTEFNNFMGAYGAFKARWGKQLTS